MGLTLDSRMTWNNHTTNISNKCCRTIGVLNRIKHYTLNRSNLFYNTLILPHFNYCITAWGYQCYRIIKLQKKAISIISISTYNAHTESLLKNLRILKIQDILLLQTLKMYHKHGNNKLPTYIQNWSLHANKEIHHHNTRQADELHTHRVLHKFAEKCLRYNLIRVVNNSQLCILNKLNTHSLTGFANYAKQIVIQKH